MRPCLLDNFLVSDPPLKQVVARTYEAGLRGDIDFGPKKGRLNWTVGAFHTTSEDDIIHVASQITGRGFFQNAGNTLRRGIEASANYKSDRWNAYASYNYIDATFQSAITLQSPGNPFAVDGLITVTPGNVIPSIPAHRFKAGVEYAVFDNWKVGADFIAVSGQYLRGDENNLNPMLPGYWVRQSPHHLSGHEAGGGVRADPERVQQSLLHVRHFLRDQRGSVPRPDRSAHASSPGAPLAAYAGVRAKF